MKEEPENNKEAHTSKSAEPAENVTSTESSTAEDDLDLASTDEVKVYKDEGEEENRSSENLSEEKLGLVIETEEGKSSDAEGKNNYSADENSNGPSHGPKMQKCSFFDRLPFGYPLLPPYPPYASGSPLVVSHGDLFPPTPGLGFYMYNDHPPPAHMGIQPLHIDPKTGLPRSSFYGLSTSPGHPPLYSTDLPHMHSLDLVSRASPASSLCGSYTSNLTAPSLAWLGASGILPPPPPPGFSYHGFNSAQSLVTSSALKQELSPRSEPSMDDIRDSRLKSTSSSGHHQSHQRFAVHGNPVGGGMNGVGHQEKKRPYVKKPLNAYMLFMKEMRQSVIEECTLKESAAINQILGRKWHALDKAEQQKYYDMAKREKELHLQMYPGWSARDNYATHTKKKKRKKESTTSSLLTSQEMHAGRRSGSNGSHIQNHINSANKNSYAVHSHNAPSHFEGHRNPFENHFDSFIHGNCGFSSDHSIISEGSCPNGQKCRSRYGLSQRHNWCKDCRNEGLEQSKYAEEERDMPPEQSIVCLSQPNIPRSIVSL